MTHYTLTVSDNELRQLHEVYKNHAVVNNNQYVLFAAKHNGTNILAYTSGRVLIQGEEITSELIAIKTYLGIEDYEAIGSDEVGTGDVFGPVVVCCAHTSIEDLRFLEKLNVRDSKNINDEKILEMGPKIAERLTHTILILNPQKYNEVFKSGYNMNKIKAVLHNNVIVKTTEKVQKQIPVILDQFCAPHLYFNYIKEEKFIYQDIEFKTKAESVHLSVAAASIIARYAFLIKMREYGEKIGFELLKGASSEVDEQVLAIHQKIGLKGLKLIAKMNFKNITKLGLS